jgi:hypothetical protein
MPALIFTHKKFILAVRNKIMNLTSDMNNHLFLLFQWNSPVPTNEFLEREP